MFTIYSLDNPENGNPFYVGMTSKKLADRLKSHISYSKRCNYPVYVFMDTLQDKPCISFLDQTYEELEAIKIERYWMEQMRQWGFTLYNFNSVPIGIKYKRTDDEILYEIYKNKGEEIPEKHLWVKQWQKHPLHPSNYIIPPNGCAEARDKVRMKYIKDTYSYKLN